MHLGSRIISPHGAAEAYFKRVLEGSGRAVLNKREVHRKINGLFASGLWSFLIGGYLLNKEENAGTGATAYGLVPGVNSTLVNGATWGLTGITCDNATSAAVVPDLPTLGYVDGVTPNISNGDTQVSMFLVVDLADNVGTVLIQMGDFAPGASALSLPCSPTVVKFQAYTDADGPLDPYPTAIDDEISFAKTATTGRQSYGCASNPVLANTIACKNGVALTLTSAAGANGSDPLSDTRFSSGSGCIGGSLNFSAPEQCINGVASSAFFFHRNLTVAEFTYLHGLLF